MKTVITTINNPNEAISRWSEKSQVIIIGDRKTPKEWHHENCDYYDLKRQKETGLEIVDLLPENHYSRKNIGYLLAMNQDKIYDTDDDNFPNEKWTERSIDTEVSHTSNQDWCNIYEPLTSGQIWPRGFPLELIKQKTILYELSETKRCPIQQGLADVSPDVDAIWRLLYGHNVFFWIKKSIWLKESWSTFNSQATWWFPEAYPLLYLPSMASFRMTDIFRSLVAQRCMWEMGYGIVFHSPSEVVQERNKHDLRMDFTHEIMGYLKNKLISEELRKIKLGSDIYKNLELCYIHLTQMRVINKKELPILKSWINDVKGIL